MSYSTTYHLSSFPLVSLFFFSYYHLSLAHLSTASYFSLFIFVYASSHSMPIKAKDQNQKSEALP